MLKKTPFRQQPRKKRLLRFVFGGEALENNVLRPFFTALLHLRHLLQAQESVEASLKKVPAPQRFLWALPLVTFAAAAVSVFLMPVIRAKRKKSPLS